MGWHDGFCAASGPLESKTEAWRSRGLDQDPRPKRLVNADKEPQKWLMTLPMIITANNVLKKGEADMLRTAAVAGFVVLVAIGMWVDASTKRHRKRSARSLLGGTDRQRDPGFFSPLGLRADS